MTNMLTDLVFRLRALLRSRTVERELDEELRLHLDHEIEKEVQRGVPRPEAMRRAHLALGGLEQVKEQCRDARGLGLVDTTRQDLRYAFRTIRRSPGFSTMAVVSLALGIGANTAIFTLINAVMLRALPVRSPEELVSVGDPSRPTAMREGAPMVDVLSYPLYLRLRDRNRVFTGLLASGRSGRVEMTIGEGAAVDVRGRLVSGNYFDVLGVPPAIGRAFSAEEERTPGTSPVVVISDALWDTRFARDPGILGRVVRLNESPFTVIGVGPRHFTGEVVGSPADIWIPLTMQAQVNPGRARLDRRDSNWLLGLGRLKPGVSIETARAEMNLLAQEALIDYQGAAPSDDTVRDIRNHRLDVRPGARGFSWIRKNVSSLLFTLMAVVALVLVIACANVANLLLARAASRQREIAVRLAIGAGRSRLIRQLLTEGVVLAAMGGATGVLLACWSSRFLSHLVSRGGPNQVPFDVDVRPDGVMLAFTVAVSLISAVLFALVPALRSTRVELSPALKVTARGLDPGRWSLGKLLVIAQLALSVPLLILAGLFVRSLANLEALDVGYSRDNLVLLKADWAASGYASPVQRLTVTRALIERLQAIPGVRGVSFSENGLFSGTDSSTQGLQVESFQPVRNDDASSSFDQVGPHYFQVLGVPVIAGRDFEESDRAGSPAVAVINETMARFYFGPGNPLGKFIQNGSDRYTIVGVVKDSKQRDLAGKPQRRFYTALLQSTDDVDAFNVEVSTHGDAAGMIPAVRRALQEFDRNLKVPSLESVRVLMAQSISGERSMAQLSGFFGALALFLVGAGLYGVMSYATSRRAQEIGLRMALGAGRGEVVGMVIRETLMLVVAGLAIGVPAALASARLISASLVGVSVGNPATVAGVITLLLIVGVSAGWVPALRASRVDPVRALRQE
jgi:predicted permease